MLTEFKLNPADFAGKNVSALPDRPGEAGMTAAQLKAAFDRSGEEVIASHINGLIDTLSGSEGAMGIRTLTGESVEQRLSQSITAENVQAFRVSPDGMLMYSLDGSTWEYAAPITVNGKEGPHIILTCTDLSAASQSALSAHTASRSNPHNVTSVQIGALSMGDVMSVQYTVTPEPDCLIERPALFRRHTMVKLTGTFFPVNQVFAPELAVLGTIPYDIAPDCNLIFPQAVKTASGEMTTAFVEVMSSGYLALHTPEAYQSLQMNVTWMLE